MDRRRPDLAIRLTGAELARWYWLKSELIGLARMLGVPKHPVGVQAFLDKNAHESDEGSEGRSEPTRHLSKAAAEV